MMVIACAVCSLALRVTGDEHEASSLIGENSTYASTGYLCPRCRHPATCMKSHEASAVALARMDVVECTVHEAFAALEGLGLPEERKCALVDVQEFFRSHTIRRVQGKDVLGSARCVVEYLEAQDGTRLYLGAGGDGAVVYRIVRPSNYANRVLKEHG